MTRKPPLESDQIREEDLVRMKLRAHRTAITAYGLLSFYALLKLVGG